MNSYSNIWIKKKQLLIAVANNWIKTVQRENDLNSNLFEFYWNHLFWGKKRPEILNKKWIWKTVEKKLCKKCKKKKSAKYTWNVHQSQSSAQFVGTKFRVFHWAKSWVM